MTVSGGGRAAQDGSTDEAFDYEELTVSASPVGLANASAQACRHSEIQFVDGPVSVRVDGPDPTAAVGMTYFNGDRRVFSAMETKRLRAIRAEATDGRLKVTYYRYVL